MREKIFRMTWALLILVGGLTAAFTPKNVDALTCSEIYNECVAACNPEDSYCGQDCQCQLIMCHGYQCN